MPVLQEVSLHVEAGQMVVVRGLSGCGKTTLLHLLATLDRPDGGVVRIEGEEVSSWSSQSLAEFRRRRLGIVYQDCALIPRFSVWQNVSVGLLPEGWSARERRERSNALLHRLGLADKADERPTRLSGGEQQRVAIARALIHEPRILIADEPTSQVDADTTDRLLALFDELRDQGVAVLVASHAAEVQERADRCLELVEGHLRQADERGDGA